MSSTNILGLLGGLALFLYGMQMMSNGLESVAGNKMKDILEKLTSNRFLGIIVGALITAVIQSSSATTVMVVGFVNSGMMTLNQAVWIIMGANIGTTITGQLIALDVGALAPLIAFIGVAIVVFSKNEKVQFVGEIIAGLGILFVGMNMMGDSMIPLREYPPFINLMTRFSNPLIGIIAGMIFTAVIQSSSASVGILQALALSGVISFHDAAFVLFGQNIGTCITALLSSIGTSRNARRTAMVHLYFNIIGTVLFLVLFYGINAFVHFPFLETSANAAGIAIVHSGFNIFATLILFPFADGLVKLAKLTIPDGPEEKADEAVQMLDTRFLDSPAFALQQCKVAAAKMAELTETGLVTSVDLMASYNEADAENVDILEKKVDHFEDALGTYLVKLSSEKLSPKDSQTLSMILHCIGDFERISDHTVNIMKAAREMHDKNLQFSSDGAAELAVYGKAVKDIVSLTFSVFNNEDVKKANEVEPLEQVIDSLNSSLKNHHIERLQSGKCTIELGFILSDVMTDFERISDHCSNIAVCVSQIHSGSFDTHEYLHALKKEEEFESEYKELKKQYQLPTLKA